MTTLKFFYGLALLFFIYVLASRQDLYWHSYLQASLWAYHVLEQRDHLHAETALLGRSLVDGPLRS